MKNILVPHCTFSLQLQASEVTDVYNEEPITAEYPCVSDALNCLDSINIEGVV